VSFSKLLSGKIVADHFIMEFNCVDQRVTECFFGFYDWKVWSGSLNTVSMVSSGSRDFQFGVPADIILTGYLISITDSVTESISELYCMK